MMQMQYVETVEVGCFLSLFCTCDKVFLHIFFPLLGGHPAGTVKGTARTGQWLCNKASSPSFPRVNTYIKYVHNYFATSQSPVEFLISSSALELFLYELDPVHEDTHG